MNSFKHITVDFQRVYKGQKATIASSACGRVELIGGHTDYNEGYVIAAAIDKSCTAAASKRDDNQVYIYSKWNDKLENFELGHDINRNTNENWSNYIRGVAAFLSGYGFHIKGMNLYIESDVPVGSGLSSSAALEVSTANAMIHLSENKIEISSIELAKICQRAENIYADSPCGIMDQLVSITARKNHAIFLDCRDLSVDLLPFDNSRCRIMIFNSMVRHEVGGCEYKSRRDACNSVCAVLSKKYHHLKALRDADENMLNSIKQQLDNEHFMRASHVIGENKRVLAAADALKDNDFGKFGQIMNESHRSARDLYQISCPETDFLAELIWSCDGSYGARIGGGGFGGAVVALVKPESVKKISEFVRDNYRKKFNINCDIYMANAWQGPQVTEL